VTWRPADAGADRCDGEADPDGLIRALALREVAFTGLYVERASLEEAVLSLTGGAA